MSAPSNAFARGHEGDHQSEDDKAEDEDGGQPEGEVEGLHQHSMLYARDANPIASVMPSLTRAMKHVGGLEFKRFCLVFNRRAWSCNPHDCPCRMHDLGGSGRRPVLGSSLRFPTVTTPPRTGPGLPEFPGPSRQAACRDPTDATTMSRAFHLRPVRGMSGDSLPCISPAASRRLHDLGNASFLLKEGNLTVTRDFLEDGFLPPPIRSLPNRYGSILQRRGVRCPYFHPPALKIGRARLAALPR